MTRNFWHGKYQKMREQTMKCAKCYFTYNPMHKIFKIHAKIPHHRGQLRKLVGVGLDKFAKSGCDLLQRRLLVLAEATERRVCVGNVRHQLLCVCVCVCVSEDGNKKSVYKITQTKLQAQTRKSGTKNESKEEKKKKRLCEKVYKDRTTPLGLTHLLEAHCGDLVVLLDRLLARDLAVQTVQVGDRGVGDRQQLHAKCAGIHEKK